MPDVSEKMDVAAVPSFTLHRVCVPLSSVVHPASPHLNYHTKAWVAPRGLQAVHDTLAHRQCYVLGSVDLSAISVWTSASKLARTALCIPRSADPTTVEQEGVKIETVEGAEAAQLSEKVRKLLGQQLPKQLSSASVPNRAPSGDGANALPANGATAARPLTTATPFTAQAAKEVGGDTDARLEQLTRSSPVMLFMKVLLRWLVHLHAGAYSCYAAGFAQQSTAAVLRVISKRQHPTVSTVTLAPHVWDSTGFAGWQ